MSEKEVLLDGCGIDCGNEASGFQVVKVLTVDDFRTDGVKSEIICVGSVAVNERSWNPETLVARLCQPHDYNTIHVVNEVVDTVLLIDVL